MLLALLLSCKDKPPIEDSSPPPVCNAGSSWTSGTVAFRDATADWGLDTLNPVGVLIDAVDFDNDGWTDLFVRSSNVADDFSDGGARTSWLLRNDGTGHFVDVTESSGVRVSRVGEGARAGSLVIWADVDGDGDLDNYTGAYDNNDSLEDTSEIVLNNGDGTFSLGAEGNELRKTKTDVPMGAAFSDVDLDGDVDLWVAQHWDAGYNPRQAALYLNDGAGNFVNGTEDRGLETESWGRDIEAINEGLAHAIGWSALACDLNNDGWPELLASSYGRAPNHLWLNDGKGAFTNQSVASGYAFDHRADWSDNESARCYCKLNPDTEGCEDVPSPSITCRTEDDIIRGWTPGYDDQPMRLGGNSGGTSCGDVDNDGWMDLATSEIVHWDVGSSSDPPELLFNTQAASVVFERPGWEATGIGYDTKKSGWDIGVISNSFFDFDNDGRLDLWWGDTDYPGTRGRLYHNLGERTFEEVPSEEGIDHTRSHGSAVADFDRDGDLDIVVGHSSMRCDEDCYDTFNVRFFENTMSDGNYLQLRLEGGEGSNRSAVGARVEVKADGAPDQVKIVDGGHGLGGQQDDMVQHFGLGTACEATVTITWPNAERTVETYNLGGGYRYLIVQGAERAEVIP